MAEKIYREALISDYPDFPIRTVVHSGKLQPVVCTTHWHEEAEIVLVRRGCGIQQAGRNFFTVHAGEISVICPDLPHSFFSLSDREDSDLLVLQFNLKQFLEQSGTDPEIASAWLSGRMTFPHALSGDPVCGSLIGQIHRELTAREAGFSGAITGALSLLLTLLYRQCPSVLGAFAPDVSESRGRALIDPAISFIADHYRQEGLSPEAAAEAASLSVTHFSRLFRQATGFTFHEYLNRYRILQAEQLFSGEMSLAQIAFACGFGSSSAFLRNYKKYRARAPREARKNRS